VSGGAGGALRHAAAQTLALANQSAVLASMLLALVSETSLLQASTSPGGVGGQRRHIDATKERSSPTEITLRPHSLYLGVLSERF
jgi:hypothetical protein